MTLGDDQGTLDGMTLTPDAINENYAVVADESASLLRRIQATEDLRIHLRAFQATLVEDARSFAGGLTSWDDIGGCLGITKQAAQQRFTWAKID